MKFSPALSQFLLYILSNVQNIYVPINKKALHCMKGFLYIVIKFNYASSFFKASRSSIVKAILLRR